MHHRPSRQAGFCLVSHRASALEAVYRRIGALLWRLFLTNRAKLVRMYAPDQICDQLQGAFDAASVIPFRRFLDRHERRNQWVLASDYVWGEPARPQDVLVFSLLPDANLSHLKRLFPKDFKKVKAINTECIEWFRSDDAFHFCFILNKGGSVFHSAGRDRGEVARESIEKTLMYVKRAAPQWMVDLYASLRRESQSPSFNVRLYGDVLLLATFYAFILGLLARDNCLVRLLWCSDRDNRTTWRDRLAYSLGLINGARRCLPFGLVLDAADLPFLILLQDPSARRFDPIIRACDYLAGAVSAWSLSQNSTSEGGPKYGSMLRDALVGNERVFLVHLEMSDQQLWARRVIVDLLRAG